jgi:hypothetical protein
LRRGEVFQPAIWLIEKIFWSNARICRSSFALGQNMSTQSIKTHILPTVILCCVLLTGCETTGEKNSASAPAMTGSATAAPSRFKTDDGRTIEIGRATEFDGGRSFKNPHLDNCWIADGFNFSGYDTLYIAPIESTAAFHNDEERPLAIAKTNLLLELQRRLETRGIVSKVVTRESDIQPGARVLRLDATIIQYSKGGGAARYFAGLYGGGQPILRVQGKITDGDKTLFRFEARRSGVAGDARMFGAYMKDEDIQFDDIRSLCLDLTDFMAAIAGKYQAKN